MKLISWTLILSLFTVHALPPIPENAVTMTLYKPPPRLQNYFYRVMRSLRLMPVLHSLWPKHMTSGLFQMLVTDHYLNSRLIAKYVVMHTKPNLEDLRLINSLQEIYEGTDLGISYQNCFDKLLESMLKDARWESAKALNILRNLPGHNQFRLLRQTLELFLGKREIYPVVFQLTKNPTMEDYYFVYELKARYAFRDAEISRGLSLLFHRLSKELGGSIQSFHSFLKALPGIQSEEFRYILTKYFHRRVIAIRAANLFFKPTESDILFLSKMHIAQEMKKDKDTIVSVTKMIANRLSLVSLKLSDIVRTVKKSRYMTSFDYTLYFPFLANDLPLITRLAYAVHHPSKENVELTRFYLKQLPPDSESRTRYQEFLQLLSRSAARPP